MMVNRRSTYLNHKYTHLNRKFLEVNIICFYTIGEQTGKLLPKFKRRKRYDWGGKLF